MKKLLCILLAAVLFIGATACGGGGGSTPTDPPATETPAPKYSVGLGLDDWNPADDPSYSGAKTYRDGDTFVQTENGMEPVTLGFEGTTFIPEGCTVALNGRNVFYIMDAEGAETNTAFFAAMRSEGETEDLLEKTPEALVEELKDSFNGEISIAAVSAIEIDGNAGIMFDIINSTTHFLSRRYMCNFDGYTYLFQFQAEESKAIADDRGDKIVAGFKFGKSEDAPPAGTDGAPTGETEEVTDMSYTIETAVYTMKITYTGAWADGAPNGEGTATVAEDVPGRFGTGDHLYGNWVDGLIQGEGVYTSSDGVYRLEGTFIDGLKEGTVKQYRNGEHIGDLEFKDGSPVS